MERRLGKIITIEGINESEYIFFDIPIYISDEFLVDNVTGEVFKILHDGKISYRNMNQQIKASAVVLDKIPNDKHYFYVPYYNEKIEIKNREYKIPSFDDFNNMKNGNYITASGYYSTASNTSAIGSYSTVSGSYNCTSSLKVIK